MGEARQYAFSERFFSPTGQMRASRQKRRTSEPGDGHSPFLSGPRRIMGREEPDDRSPMADLTPLDILRTTFGYPSFRPHQAEIVDAALAGRDVLAVMPTSAGKSWYSNLDVPLRSLSISPAFNAVFLSCE